MLCKKYEELSPFERVEFIGKLVHAVQSDDVFFDEAKVIIYNGEVFGTFEGVKILPDNGKEEEEV